MAVASPPFSMVAVAEVLQAAGEGSQRRRRKRWSGKRRTVGRASHCQGRQSNSEERHLEESVCGAVTAILRLLSGETGYMDEIQNTEDAERLTRKGRNEQLLSKDPTSLPTGKVARERMWMRNDDGGRGQVRGLDSV